jgi:hypothetical protein
MFANRQAGNAATKRHCLYLIENGGGRGIRTGVTCMKTVKLLILRLG